MPSYDMRTTENHYLGIWNYQSPYEKSTPAQDARLFRLTRPQKGAVCLNTRFFLDTKRNRLENLSLGQTQTSLNTSSPARLQQEAKFACEQCIWCGRMCVIKHTDIPYALCRALPEQYREARARPGNLGFHVYTKNTAEGDKSFCGKVQSRSKDEF